MTMTIPELAELAHRTRQVREAGLALLLASSILALFLFVPLGSSKRTDPDVQTVAPPVPLTVSPIDAKAAIIYDLATGEILYEKNADAQLPLASLTKLLTVYAALTELSPQTPITVSSLAATAEYPHAFAAGDTLMLSDLARLTLTASLNDGAAAIAEATAAQVQSSTADMLAGAASALGLSATYAVNGSGLDLNTVVSGGYGSARDIARLAGALAEGAPDVANATTFANATAVSAKGRAYKAINTDPMTSAISRLLLSKTGYTDLAGGNLALVFDAGIRHPVAVVVLGSSKEARFTDGIALVNAALAHFAGVTSL